MGDVGAYALQERDAWRERAKRAEARVAVLEAALVRYGDHDEDCEEEPCCSCGFIQAMRGEKEEVK